jgi:hypothetical protein
VVWSDGKREIVEVKYLSDLRTNQERFKERFAAMEDWSEMHERLKHLQHPKI